MENTEFTRNINISTKVTFQEKIDIQRIANKYNISLYELIYTLVMNFKDYYQYIGQTSPKEEKIIKEVEALKKANRKLNSQLENAEHRLEMETGSKNEAINEANQLRYKNVELTNLLTNKKKELKTANAKIQSYNLETNEIRQTAKRNLFSSAVGLVILISTIFIGNHK